MPLLLVLVGWLGRVEGFIDEFRSRSLTGGPYTRHVDRVWLAGFYDALLRFDSALSASSRAVG